MVFNYLSQYIRIKGEWTKFCPFFFSVQINKMLLEVVYTRAWEINEPTFASHQDTWLSEIPFGPTGAGFMLNYRYLRQIKETNEV